LIKIGRLCSERWDKFQEYKHLDLAEKKGRSVHAELPASRGPEIGFLFKQKAPGAGAWG